MLQVKLHQLFYGGVATDKKVGFQYSHAYSRALDFRKQPGRLTTLPGSREIGDNNVADLILNIVQADNGERFAVGDQGWVYKIDNSNVVTTVGKLDDGNGAGMLFRRDTDEMYISSSRTVSRYGKFNSGVIQLELNKYKESRSEDTLALREGGTTTCSLSSSIDEQQKIEFTPDIEPLMQFKVEVDSKGTGDWTCTIHDDANNVLDTDTVATADIPTSGLVTFSINQVRMLVKPNARTYHAHITSSDSTGDIKCATQNTMNTANFEMWADRLVETNNDRLFHPIEQFLHLTVIGNERYLSVWEPLSDNPSNLEWQRHRLTFPPGYEVIGLAANDEYLCIATEMRSEDTERSFQHGKLFFWNGLDTTYEFYIDVPEGPPQSVFTFNNMIYMVINGALYAWPGGKNLVKLRTIADTDTEFSDSSDVTEVFPNMMAIRRNTLMVGYPSVTENTNLESGIYSWGQKEKNFPMTLGLNYSISTGSRFTTDSAAQVKIGCVRSFGDTLYFSWYDGDVIPEQYGLDIVDNNSDPASSSSWESLEFEAGDGTHDKTARRLSIILSHSEDDTIPSGYTITPKYRTNWTTDWAYGDPLTAANEYSMDIDVRFKMIEYGFDITNDSATEPLQIGTVKFVYDDNVGERER